MDGINVDEGYKCPNCNLDGIIALCKEKEEKLHLAGEYGLQLQEELQESHTHMEEMRTQFEAQVEGMIQEIYELKIKLDTVERSLGDQKMIMKQSVEDFNIKKEGIINESNEKMNLLKKENASVLAQFNQGQLRERQLEEKVAQLEEKNTNLLSEKQKKREDVNASYTHEMFVLHEKLIEMEDSVEASNTENIKLRNENEMVCLSLKTMKEEVLAKQNELEAAENQSTSYYNHLEKAREETKEVKAELEALKLQLKQSGHQSKGNSLFGEVEDERMMMEKKLKTMEIKFESLQKAYAFLKSQHHNLKSQVTALLSLHSGKADIDYIRNIERTLSQLKSENAELVNKLKVSQENGETEEIQEINLKELARNLPNFESNEDVVEFLTIKLEENKAHVRKLHEELDRTHMVKMAESDKLLTAEQKLHETGISAERFKNENMKLRLKLEETENKFKAEFEKRVLVEKKFNYDSSNDVEPIGISNIKVKSPPPFMKRERNKTNKIMKENTIDEKKAKSILAPDMEWSEVLKILQKGKEQKKQECPVGETVQKIRWSEHDDIIPDELPEDDETSTSEQKINFKDEQDVFLSSSEKENVTGNDTHVKKEVKISSCLKKTSHNIRKSYKDHNFEKSKEQNIRQSAKEVVDDKPCDVQ